MTNCYKRVVTRRNGNAHADVGRQMQPKERNSKRAVVLVSGKRNAWRRVGKGISEHGEPI